MVDKNKLPNGIEGLLSDAKKHGVKFGIWIEPEMANTTSELYEKHPDLVLKTSERDVVLGRVGTQVVLDFEAAEGAAIQVVLAEGKAVPLHEEDGAMVYAIPVETMSGRRYFLPDD